jgi:cation transport ATPase
MKLTPTQLDKLDAFILQKGIFYTEVREEILDHLACAVEEKMAQDPSLSFERAIDPAYASFGISGFLDIEKSIQERIFKEIKTHQWVNIQLLFTPKRVTIPIVLWFVAREVVQLVSNKPTEGWWWVLMATITLTFFLLWYFWRIHYPKIPRAFWLQTIQQRILITYPTIVFSISSLARYLHEFGEEVFLSGMATLLTLVLLYYWAAYQTYQWGKATLRPPQMTC